MKIELESVDGIYKIGDYYIWMEEEGFVGKFAYYTSAEEAKKDMDEYYDKIAEALGRYWSTRCPQ